MQKYAESLVEKFMDQGYNKEESIKICNYMIGEEQLKEDEAKTKVNEEIKENNRKKIQTMVRTTKMEEHQEEMLGKEERIEECFHKFNKKL